jgi:hypothetical protein
MCTLLQAIGRSFHKRARSISPKQTLPVPGKRVIGNFDPRSLELAANETQDVRAPSWGQCLGIELADAAVGADDEGEGEGIPVFVGVGWVGV